MTNWDQLGAAWDQLGLFWDQDVSQSQYFDLITSEHNQKPKYMAMLEVVFRPLIDGQDVAASLNTLFDLDTAVGVQLDVIGMWIGRTRFLKTPITGVYFTYDTGPGYESGIYLGPFDPVTGLTALPDEFYRLYLKAVAAANSWNGERETAYEAYDIMFSGTPFQVVIIDNQNMSMDLALVGGVPDPLTEALFSGGYLDLKPEGVRINNYIVPVVEGPVFAYDTTGNPNFGGYDVGAYAKHISPS